MMSRRILLMTAMVALVALAGGTVAAAQQQSGKRWLLYQNEYRLVDWSLIESVWFDTRDGTANLEGPSSVKGKVSDASEVQKVRTAITADVARWVRMQTQNAQGGNPWDNPDVVPAYGSLPHVWRVIVLQAIDAPNPDKEVMLLFDGQNVEIGRLTDGDAKARLKALLKAPWR
jgi:hypothetical protein